MIPALLLLDDLLRLGHRRKKPLRYLSLCSGIEAATSAWHSLGWEPVAFCEIEKFPAAVLAYRYPRVPNLGDMTRWEEWFDDLLASVDILVGGTPCQAFSVAGLRNSLNDTRGNLTLVFAGIAERIDAVRAARGLPPAIIVWENVPGVLTTRDNAFGCLLGALAGEDEAVVPAGKKWTNAGLVSGPERTVAWRVLDAQYFGVAQRRRRVFLVGSAREGFRPGEVLFEFDGVRRDSAPGRTSRQGPTYELAPCLAASGRGFERTGDTGGQDCVVPTWWDGGQVSQTLDAVLAKGQTMPEKNRFPAVLVPATAHTLRGEGFDASEDGTGRGTPLVPVAFVSGGHGALKESSVGDPVRATGGDTGGGGETIVAFSCKDHGGDAGDVSPTLRSMNHSGSHANAGGQVAVCFDTTQITSRDNRSNPQPGDPCHPLASGAHPPAIAGTLKANLGKRCGQADGSDAEHLLVPSMTAVRRLTPRECERLQGFPDDFTLIPWRGKPAAECPDGPRYKALGNSMAVPCMLWIGERIAKEVAR